MLTVLCDQQSLEAKVPKPTHQDLHIHIPEEQLGPGAVISWKAAHSLGSPSPECWNPGKVHGCPLDGWDTVLLSSFSLHSLFLDLDTGDSNLSISAGLCQSCGCSPVSHLSHGHTAVVLQRGFHSCSLAAPPPLLREKLPSPGE